MFRSRFGVSEQICGTGLTVSELPKFRRGVWGSRSPGAVCIEEVSAALRSTSPASAGGWKPASRLRFKGV